jgi:S-DNA-T family DNA segregation ATPase FtsK/SpoIIIE
VRLARAIATHETTRTVVRASGRNTVFVLVGARLAGRRIRDAGGLARYERLLRHAEATADTAGLLEWEQRAEQARQRRHDRRMRWLNQPFGLAKAVLAGAVTVLGILVVLGVILAVSGGRAADVWVPLATAGTVLRWLILAVSFLLWWPVLLVAAPVSALVGCWWAGRKTATVPAWLATPAERAQSYAILTEDLISTALANSRVSALNQALKRGGALEYVITPREQAGGTYAQVRLPLGAVAADFLTADPIERLAGNLGRHKHEVYPQRQPDADARVLDLWVADQGTMDKPAPAWPLLTEGEFDVFRDRLPLGVTPRGEPIEQGMLNRHGLTGASSKQGKTAYVRLKFLGLSLDPTAELRIADLKGDGDWSMFAPRAHTLIEGSAIEQTTATCQMLEQLVAEMVRRYDAKRAAGIRGNITRELSRRPGSGFHPIFAVVDECQVLYAEELPIGGTKNESRAWKASKRLHDQARAVNIHLDQATQRPNDRTLPVPVREGVHVRSALYVPNYTTAKMVLADAADMGARPQDLRMGRDAGTVVLTGEIDDLPTGMAFVICKSHYVDTHAAYAVIERAMQILARHGRRVHDTDEPGGEPARDFIADLNCVLRGQARERTEVLRQRLAELHAPTYEGLSAVDLSTELKRWHIPIRKSNGQSTIAAEDVAQAWTAPDEDADEATDTDP